MKGICSILRQEAKERGAAFASWYSTVQLPLFQASVKGFAPFADRPFLFTYPRKGRYLWACAGTDVVEDSPT